MNCFREVIRVARNAIISARDESLDEYIGVTQGQVLQIDGNKIKMTACPLLVKVHYTIRRPSWSDRTVGKNSIGFMPLTQNYALRKFWYPSEEWLDNITNHSHDFGGETIIFNSDGRHRFELGEPIEYQIKKYAAKILPATPHRIYEHIGCIVIGSRVLFGSEVFDRYTDTDEWIVREYDRLLSWTEPSQKRPIDENGVEMNLSEHELLAEMAEETRYTTNIIPTLIYQNGANNEESIYLDFATEWNQTNGGQRIIGKVGGFKVYHEVKDGKLTTTTKMRATESMWVNGDEALCYA